ncbi:hypothetical protein [Neorhizobium vignae]|jgi:hypothetical protein|uniref:hypothetical protein n=1 Tax=Neorhizobium vignae TaxID=690585 RepID=UPI000AE1180E|nr:hypothetical protein [Neorhizobium vignae]
MNEFLTEVDDAAIEILTPDRDRSHDDRVVCLCCRQARSKSWMDDDGCGICEECLAI